MFIQRFQFSGVKEMKAVNLGIGMFGLLTAIVAVAQESPEAPPVPSKPAEGETLTLGNDAPELQIAEWLKGEKVAGFAAGKVYVVEFWATWCPPCRASMPHLSELQAEYGEKVTIIGISNEDNETVTGFFAQDAPSETNAEGADEAEASDEDEAKTWEEAIGYTIALDDHDGTGKAYMQAAGQSGIPTAFIVGKQGKIEWIGHPMSIDEPLSAVVAGTWDREAALKAMEEEKRAELAQRAAMGEIQAAVAAKDFATAVKIVDSLVEEFPNDEALPMMRLQVIRMSGDTELLGQAIEKQAQTMWDDSESLNALVWMFVGRERSEGLPIDVLEKTAKRACELTEYKDGSLIDTFARVYYQAGDLDKAIEWQQKAVAAGGEMSAEFEKSLKAYIEVKNNQSTEGAVKGSAEATDSERDE